MITSDCPPHQVREAFVLCDEEVRTASLAYREGTSNYVAGSNLRQLGALRLQLGERVIASLIASRIASLIASLIASRRQPCASN